MPKRIAVQTVVLWREGQQVVPPVGKPFDFTKEELETIEKLNPDAVTKIVNADSNDTLVTKTQAEIDAEKQDAIDAAIAAFKKEKGIKDEPKSDDTGAGSADANKAAGNKADKGANKPAGAKPSADDDI